MTSRPRLRQTFACTLIAFACLNGNPSPASAQGMPTLEIPAEIPMGPASDNAETSRGLAALLNWCMQSHKAVDTMHATGRYLTITKTEDEPTTYNEAKITVDFRRPGKLAVHSLSDLPALNSTFVANGTSVTMAWTGEESTSTTRLYKVTTQTDSLAAYTDLWRAGEILKEYSDTLPQAPPAQLVVSDDYFGLDDPQRRFVYEGIDQVNGRDCHQVRIIDDHTDGNIIHWIDTATGMLWKISYIYSYDADYTRVDSFADGVEATMQVATFDTITTSADSVTSSAFTWSVPPDYEPFQPLSATGSASDDDNEESSFWASLVSSAANTGNLPTTRSLTSTAGPVQLRMSPALTLPVGFSPESLSVATVRLPGQSAQALAFASEDGIITVRDFNDREITSVSLGVKISFFECMETTTGELMQFLTATEDKRQLIGWSPEGNRLWTYEHEDYQVKSIECVPGEPFVYVLVNGVRKIDARGQVVYGTLTGEYANLVTPMPASVDRAVLRYTVSQEILDKSLNLLDKFTASEIFVSTRWDEEMPTAPFVSLLATRRDRDMLVQRRTEAGDVVWTVNLAPRLQDVKSGGVVWARLKVNGQVQRCLLTAVSSGHILILQPNGQVLYRGQLTADPATVKRNGGTVIANMELADMDGDGVDEFYTVMEREVLRLESF